MIKLRPRLLNLLEKLDIQMQENELLKVNFTESEMQSSNLRQQLGKAQNELAQLEERVKRLPELNRQLEQAKGEGINLSQNLSLLREKVASAESTIVAQKKQMSEGAQALAEIKGFRDGLMEEKERLQTSLATLEAELDAERLQGKEKLALLHDPKSNCQISLKLGK